MASDQAQLAEQYMGKLVPYSFNGGFVCLSYGISLIGTGTSLELIRRRTSHRGLHNLLLLLGAAIAMGGIAIWSMHFIGNRAIYMLDGEETAQIAYSTALTVMSLLLPILVLVLAFLGVSGSGHTCWYRIVFAGILSGGAICGMHYLANASISNYVSTYKLSYLIGSIIIAVLASTTALALFFVFEKSWSNAWWKRIGCAMVLAGAVSGMHWCAAVGTRYRLVMVTPGKGVSRQNTMIVVICLAISAGVLMTCLAIYSTWVRHDYASKSQQVVLAAGVFDDKGRIMVTQDGYLPSEVVTDTYLPKSNDDVFNTNHPLFHWMFRASRNWDTMTKMMGKMARHIALLAHENNTGRAGRAGVKLVGVDGLLVNDYDTILRELFCVTAEALATKTKETLSRAGTLWDDMFVTGESRAAPRKRPVLSMDSFSMHGLAEKGFQPNAASVQEYGRGCLMFLVRRADGKRDVERLEAAGFRFAEVHQVVGTIRASMHIKTPDLEARLRAMSTQRDSTTLLAPGVHVGLFAVRARLDRSGFDVLAQKSARNLLPCVALPMKRLDPAHEAFVFSLRGLTLAAILGRIERQLHFISTDEKTFATALRAGMSTLRDVLGDEAFDEATLLPRSVQLPCAGSQRSGQPQQLARCTLIAFQLVMPIHASPLAPHCEFTPLTFFKMRQLTYDGSPHHVDFSHMVHRDLSSGILDAPSRAATVSSPVPPTSIRKPSLISRAVSAAIPCRRGAPPTRPILPTTRSQERFANATASMPCTPHSPDSIFDDSSSQDSVLKEVVTTTIHHHNKSDGRRRSGSTSGSPDKHLHMHSLGGIMVSQEVSINVQHQDVDDAAEMVGMGGRSRAGTVVMAERFYSATAGGAGREDLEGRFPDAAFVDELFGLTMKADKRAFL
ncbi:hypothetical protein E4U56_001700 [Claviceps arundinis]|uniref:MHYT domain-containing protein n=1 Tax=Claviceps arundinis TaxID=1623583 RepID=A0A9P7N099_9HYPO|nr:hypothetical protein E4U56_001700 [Claviceps arundinis]